jgi:hypothetical protein
MGRLGERIAHISRGRRLRRLTGLDRDREILDSFFRLERRGFWFGLSLVDDGANYGDQPIAHFGDCLNISRRMRVVPDLLSKKGDATGESVVGDKRIRPDGGYQTLLADDLAMMRGQMQQHFHHFGLKTNRLGVTCDCV